MMMVMEMIATRKPRMLSNLIWIESWEHITREMDQVKRPNYRLSISRASLLFQGCSLVNRWGRLQTRTMTKYMVKKEIKKWIQNVIPVKPLNIRRGNKRREERRNPPPIFGGIRGARREREMRNQPGIRDYLMRRFAQDRDDTRTPPDDALQQGDVQGDHHQWRGRPPDS